MCVWVCLRILLSFSFIWLHSMSCIRSDCICYCYYYRYSCEFRVQLLVSLLVFCMIFLIDWLIAPSDAHFILCVCTISTSTFIDISIDRSLPISSSSIFWPSEPQTIQPILFAMCHPCTQYCWLSSRGSVIVYVQNGLPVALLLRVFIIQFGPTPYISRIAFYSIGIIYSNHTMFSWLSCNRIHSA